MIPGDVHTNFSVKLEKADADADDPFALGPTRSLKAYTVAWNTWSIDGLPGVKTDAERASREDIKKMMIKYGLPPPPEAGNISAAATRYGLGHGRLRAFLALLLGLLLGSVLTVAVQNGLHVARGTQWAFTVPRG